MARRTYLAAAPPAAALTTHAAPAVAGSPPTQAETSIGLQYRGDHVALRVVPLDQSDRHPLRMAAGPGRLRDG